MGVRRGRDESAAEWLGVRWWRSMRFAFAGLRFAWRTQANFRIEVVCAALALGAAVWVRAPLAPILLSCALVLSLELVNTAVEALVDLASPELHPLAKTAKDVAAAAVLIAAVFAVGVALVELLPRVLALG